MIQISLKLIFNLMGFTFLHRETSEAKFDFIDVQKLFSKTRYFQLS